MLNTKASVLAELTAEFHLSPVLGRKPTAADVDCWEDEAAKSASSIKTNAVPEAEYQLEIEDDTHEFVEQEQPATYPTHTMTGDEEDWEQKQKVAEHCVIEEEEWFRREIQKVVDSTWIAELKKPRSGYAGVTLKKFFQHLRSNVAKLTNKEKKEMSKKIEFEWDQTMNIKEYFDKLYR